MTARVKVHPVADLFPMLEGDDLKELADSIKEQGLLEPIVLDSEDRILDGRNRYAACKIAKVEPDYVYYEGKDPDLYALTVNIARRHMSKGSLAMVAAKYRFSEPGVPRGDITALAQKVGVARSMIGHAATVLTHAPELVDAVIAGASLNEAYQFALERKREDEDAKRDEAEREERERQLALKYEEKLDAERERIRQTLDEIGPAVRLDPSKLPKRPKKEAALPPNADAGPTIEHMRESKAYLDALIAVKRKLEEVAERPVPEGMEEWLAQGVYSSFTQIASTAADIAKKCGAVDTTLRRVK